MAGVYGPINSRADYYRILDEAIATADRYLSAVGPDATYDAIKRQLVMMKAATANGREPSDEQKDQVDIGLIAVREFEEGNPGGARLAEWADQLGGLDAYFEGWPDDDLAAEGPQTETSRVITQRAVRRYATKT